MYCMILSNDNIRRLSGVMATALLVLYPLFVYLGLTYLQAKHIGFLLLLVFAFRFIAARDPLRGASTASMVVMIIVGAVVCLMAVVLNHVAPLKLYPLLINAILAIVFYVSLLNPPTIIERIARYEHPDLSENGIRHTRRVTKVWFGFFLVNGLVSAYTVFFTSLEIWTLYNGVISYGLMAVLFAGEYAIRRKIIRRERAVVD